MVIEHEEVGFCQPDKGTIAGNDVKRWPFMTRPMGLVERTIRINWFSDVGRINERWCVITSWRGIVHQEEAWVLILCCQEYCKHAKSIKASYTIACRPMCTCTNVHLNANII